MQNFPIYAEFVDLRTVGVWSQKLGMLGNIKISQSMYVTAVWKCTYGASLLLQELY